MNKHAQAIDLVKQIISNEKKQLTESEAHLVANLLMDFVNGDEELRTIPELFYIRKLFSTGNQKQINEETI